MKMGCSICNVTVLETNDSEMQNQFIDKVGLVFCRGCGIKYSYLTKEANSQ